MEKTSVVVVTHNRLSFLKECIDALKKQTLPISTIIIINNNSNDGTEEYLKKYSGCNKFIIVNLTENIGGAGGFNRGIKCFMEDTTDNFVWIMDDDTIPMEDAHYEFMQAAKEIGDFGFLAGDVRWIDGSPAKMNIPTIDKEKWNELSNYPKITIATFVSILIKRDIILKVGLPIKDFFIWGDDTEYTLRISKKYNCYYVPKSIVIHKILVNIDASIYNDASDKSRLERYKYAYRNRLYISKKKGFPYVVLYFVKVIFDSIRIMFLRTPNKLHKLKLLLKGVISGCSFRPKIELVDKWNEENY